MMKLENVHETMEIEQRRPRRGNCTGSLRLRGRTFWARWKYKGKTYERSTGITITMPRGRERAIRKMDEFTAPYRALSEKELQAYFAARIKTLGEDALEAHVRGSELTLGEAFAAFVKSPRRRTVKQSSITRYERSLERLCEKMGRDTMMNDVTPAAAETYAEELGEHISNLTFNNYIATIRHVWDVLATRNHKRENPWSGICMREDDSVSREPLSDEEVERLKAAAGDDHDGEVRLLIVVGANTGMRIGDCARLKWEDIDMEHGFIRVTTQKTGRPVSIPLLADLRRELETRRRDPSSAFVMPGMAGRKSACCIIDRIFKRSGVKQVASGQHGRKTRVVKSFHSLRSRFVTMCAEAGIPLEIVKVVVGHTTQKMTEHYAHIREKAVKEAFDRAGVR